MIEETAPLKMHRWNQSELEKWISDIAYQMHKRDEGLICLAGRDYVDTPHGKVWVIVVKEKGAWE